MAQFVSIQIDGVCSGCARASGKDIMEERAEGSIVYATPRCEVSTHLSMRSHRLCKLF